MSNPTTLPRVTTFSDVVREQFIHNHRGVVPDYHSDKHAYILYIYTRIYYFIPNQFNTRYIRKSLFIKVTTVIIYIEWRSDVIMKRDFKTFNTHLPNAFIYL